MAPRDDVKALTDQQIIKAGDLDDATARERLSRMLAEKIREVSSRREMAKIAAEVTDESEAECAAIARPKKRRGMSGLRIMQRWMGSPWQRRSPPSRPLGPQGRPQCLQPADLVALVTAWQDAETAVRALATSARPPADGCRLGWEAKP